MSRKKEANKEPSADGMEATVDMYRIYREINHWRHDMLAELRVLYCMQKDGKYSEVEAYMEKMCSELKDYPELPQPTGNEGLDAALMKAISECRKKRIQFSYRIWGKAEKIDKIVLGKFMDSLLCNGIEACQNLSGPRVMELVVREEGDGMEIYLENSIEESVLENNPKLISHKKNKERHGFGIENICCIVEKYEGIYEYWEEENRFCQQIYLKCGR